MPQMAPLMWSYLFLYFIIVLILFITMNYFMKIYYPSLTSKFMKFYFKLWKL
uniref:ATP synthase complex subunit 8 n=1 Tax=Pyrhila pisum TaxID=1550678 RepID=A0A165TXA4_PYRPS|nr:ATP synthase F0 subunit 8 [Pyrhila pisum]AMY96223.1 ATP synthase F0 subunit 8 [Pyrhila pisum]